MSLYSLQFSFKFKIIENLKCFKKALGFKNLKNLKLQNFEN